MIIMRPRSNGPRVNTGQSPPRARIDPNRRILIRWIRSIPLALTAHFFK
jgi:hypothetical protein